MKQKSIIVLNYYSDSNGRLIDDIHKLGMEPILFLTKSYGKLVSKVNAKIIHEKSTYQETLKLLRSYNPLTIFTGTESDVEKTSRLQKDLHLKFANPYRYLKEQTRKDKMQEALKKAGIRYIRGEVAHTAKEAVQIFKKLKVRKVIVKPPRAAACNCLSFCCNEKEVYKAASEFFKNGANSTIDKSSKDLLVQECIEGIEYFVNTASCNGHHKITQIWKYLIKPINNRMVIVNAESYDKMNKETINLIEYTKKVLDAVHIINGPVHSEFMVDEKGPVLIEVNCRFSGGALNTKFSDAVFGHHDTDLVINALLHPESFIKHANGMFHTYRKGYMEIINSPYCCKVKSRPIFNIITRLPSFYDTNNKLKKIENIEEQIGFVTNCGIIHLLHENADVALRDSRLIEEINEHYFYLFFEDVDHNKEDLPKRIAKGETLDILFPVIVSRGLTLILNDKKINNVPYATVTDLKNVGKELDGYAYGVINLKKNYDHLLREDYIEGILTMMDKIRTGGTIYISERSANLFPYGFKGYEMLLKVAGFKDIKKKNSYLIATKIR